MSKESQCDRVLEYIDTFGSISTLEAFRDLGVARLASRIWDIRKKGYTVECDWVCQVNRYGEPVRFKRYTIVND